jgi:hypothetical protein
LSDKVRTPRANNPAEVEASFRQLNVELDAMDSTYLRTDGTNDPVTGDITIRVTSTAALSVQKADGFPYLAVNTTAGAVAIPALLACSGAATFSAAGTGLTVSNNALVSGDLTVSGTLTVSTGLALTGNLTPSADVTYTCGTDSYRWLTTATRSVSFNTAGDNWIGQVSALGDGYIECASAFIPQADNTWNLGATTAQCGADRYWADIYFKGNLADGTNTASLSTIQGAVDLKTTLDALNGLMKCDGAGNYSAVTDNSSNWDTAFGWGDHSVEGYLTAEADTLATVTARGATTSDALDLNGSVDLDSNSTTALTVGNGSIETLLVDSTNRGVGINVSPGGGNVLRGLKTFTATSGQLYGMNMEAAIQAASASSATYYGGKFFGYATSGVNYTGTIWGFYGHARMIGASAPAVTLTNAIGAEGFVDCYRGGGSPWEQSAITNAYGLKGTIEAGFGGTITNAYGVHVDVGLAVAGTITTGYGIFIADVDATTKWGFYNNKAAAHNLDGLDNTFTKWGTDADCGILYDGTDMKIKPDLVGGGCVMVTTDSDQAKEAFQIDQNDADQAFIDYEGTSAANANNNISTWTTGNSVQGHVRVEINGVVRWMRFYDAPTS